MTDMLKTGLTWLAGQQKANVSELVTVFRGSSSFTALATFASQILRVSDRQGNTKVERAAADFIFTASDYNFGAGVVEPAAGDVIQFTFGTVTKQFKAMPVNSGQEPAWRYCDPYQISVRVHTKYIGT
jgi:hypothetical protein